MRWLASALIALALIRPAAGQEPVGCDKFKWPLDHERAMLAAAVPAQTNAAPLKASYRLTLAADAKQPLPPTRTPKAGGHGGAVNLAAPDKAGIYRVTLSEAGWIDIFQNGTALKPGSFTGAVGCPGLRKSVKFNLIAEPLVVEISGAAAASISFVITPD